MKRQFFAAIIAVLGVSFIIGSGAVADTTSIDFAVCENVSIERGYVAEHSAAVRANDSFFFGPGNRATEYGSAALGNGSEAIGFSAIAIGNGNRAIGFSATAIGRGNEAYGESSFAAGIGSKAMGFNTTALGRGTLATGHSAVAIGTGSKAMGSNSISIGRGTETCGRDSVAVGLSAQTLHDGALVFADAARDATGNHPSFASTAENQVAFRATGGFRVVGAINDDGSHVSSCEITPAADLVCRTSDGEISLMTLLARIVELEARLSQLDQQN